MSIYRPNLSSEQRVRLCDAISRFSECRILVIGDIMLDTFLWGEVSRISPEAPVPVVEVQAESQLLGGSANVANNVAGLGGQVVVSGVVGNDSAGHKLVELFQCNNIGTDGLIFEDGRPTTTKTRVIARNQQVVRFDREWRAPLQDSSTKEILSFLRKNLTAVDALIVSDYAKGVVTKVLLDNLRTIVTDIPVPVMVDPKVQHIDYYRSFTMVTPNHHEAENMSGIQIRDEESLVRVGQSLLRRLECKTLLITRGREGMSLFHQDGTIHHIPTLARHVYDVTGAGDTVIATMTLAMVAGLSAQEAALLANLAAGIVVGEVGTAAVSREQLLAMVDH